MPSLTRYYAMLATATTADTAKIGMSQRRHAASPSMISRKSGRMEFSFTVTSAVKLKLQRILGEGASRSSGDNSRLLCVTCSSKAHNAITRQVQYSCSPSRRRRRWRKRRKPLAIQANATQDAHGSYAAPPQQRHHWHPPDHEVSQPRSTSPTMSPAP